MPEIKKNTNKLSKSETALKAEEMYSNSDIFKFFIDCAEHFAIIKDTSFKFITVNQIFLDYAGYTDVTDVIGKTNQEIFKGKTSPEQIAEMDKYDKISLGLPKGENLAVEFILPTPGGKTLTFLSRRFAIYDDKDQVIGIGSLSANITERKEIEAELHNVRKKLREQILVQDKILHDANENLQFMDHVFQKTLDGVIITDKSGATLRVNPAFTEMTGYTLDEIKGANPRILKSDYHDDEFYQQMWKSLAIEGKWTGELWNRRKNGEIYPQRLSISAIYDSEGKITHYVGVSNDLSELKRKDEKINFYTYHDALTNLPNRQLFSDRLRTEINRCARKKCQIALLYIDFDDFKKVNDSLGYHIGDDLLKLFTTRIKEIIIKPNIFARIGSDEFAVALVDFNTVNSIMSVAKKIKALVQEPYKIKNHDIFLNASIGISSYPEDADTPEHLLQHADTAMHQIKGEDGNGNEVRFYTSQMQVRAQNKIDMESAIRQGLLCEEFIPFYQAKINSITGKIFGMEALARWVKDDGKIIPPSEFIDFAEELNLIGDIDSQILEISVRDMATWEEAGHKNLTVSVNISAKELEDPKFTSRVLDTLRKYNLDNSNLELEITESLIMKNVEEKIKILEKLSNTGINFSIDDFGTGYSSLSYLKKLPINTLKIDRSFVHDISEDPNDMAIVSAIISMASKIGLKVIAEGVERAEQVELLKKEGCNLIQGYYYTKPLPKNEFLNFLALKA